VPALHQLRALVLAAEKIMFILLPATTELGALNEQVSNPTMTFELEVYRTRITGSWMTTLITRMAATSRSIYTASRITLFAINP
jgi:hypothetical protein